MMLRFPIKRSYYLSYREIYCTLCSTVESLFAEEETSTAGGAAGRLVRGFIDCIAFGRSRKYKCSHKKQKLLLFTLLVLELQT